MKDCTEKIVVKLVTHSAGCDLADPDLQCSSSSKKRTLFRPYAPSNPNRFIYHILLRSKRKLGRSPAILRVDVETEPDDPGTHADPAIRNRLASAGRDGVSPRHRDQLGDRSDNHGLRLPRFSDTNFGLISLLMVTRLVSCQNAPLRSRANPA
jgi:hypothetical protein